MPQLDGKQIKDSPDGISAAKINADAVTTVKILDLNVTEAKLANSAVTTGKLNDTAVTEAKLNTSVAGAGLTGGGGSALAIGATAGTSSITVNADDIALSIKATGALEIEATGQGELDVKDLGIDEARLADLSVATGKIQADAVDETKLDLSKTYDFAGGGGGVQVSTPSTGNDAANKTYVDNLASGLKWKESVVAKTTAWAEMSSYTFTGGEWTGVTSAPSFDGVTVADQERVIVAHGEAVTPESAPGNGIFYYDDASDKLIRTSDADTWDELVAAAAFVEEGTSNADTGWVCTVDAGGTLDTTDITLAQFTGGAAYTGGDGIDVTGTVISADLKTSGGLKIDTAQIMVEPTDFAGDGLEDDGSDNMRLDLKAGGGLKIDTGEAAVEPTDFAGAGLEDDGSDNLRIATSAAGNGLTGGGGSALAVSPDAEASVVVDSSGVRAAVAYTGDKAIAPSNCTTDYASTGISPTVNPAGGSYAVVTINGLEVEVAADRLSDAYWSIDAGANAQALTAVTTSSVLYWNAVIAKYNLSSAKDIVSLDYDYVV